jgi:hypothetical protein
MVPAVIIGLVVFITSAAAAVTNTTAEPLRFNREPVLLSSNVRDRVVPEAV